jgi:hypothetical protein
MAIGISGRFSLVEAADRQNWVLSFDIDGMPEEEKEAMQAVQVDSAMLAPQQRAVLKMLTMRHGGSLVAAFCAAFHVSPREVV